MSIPEDNYFVSLRTRTSKEGDAQVGLTYGAYVIVFGAMVMAGAISSESPTMLNLRFADYLVVIDGEIKHLCRSEFDNLVGDKSTPTLTSVTLEDFSDLFVKMGIRAPSAADARYERYLELIRKMNEGHTSAGDVGRALREWQRTGAELHKEAASILDEIQFTFDLDGGSIDGEQDGQDAKATV